MDSLVLALFDDQQSAGRAIARLKQEGFTNDISLIASDRESGDIKSHQVKQDVSDGAVVGAVTGAGAGALAGLLAGLSNIVLPGIGPFVVGGSLAATWGIAGGVLGAFSGGIIGALIDAGIPDEQARMYEEAIRRGEVFVVVSASQENASKAERIYEQYGANNIATIEK